MNQYNIERVAQSLRSIKDRPDRCRVAQDIGLVLMEGSYGAGFDWHAWNAMCNVGSDPSLMERTS